MNRRRLAIIAGIIILAAALLMLLWPDNQADPRTEDKVAETELPEGFVLIDDDQIRAAEIKVAAVQTGATVELVFPATVAASPTASARIDARMQLRSLHSLALPAPAQLSFQLPMTASGACSMPM